MCCRAVSAADWKALAFAVHQAITKCSLDSEQLFDAQQIAVYATSCFFNAAYAEDDLSISALKAMATEGFQRECAWYHINPHSDLGASFKEQLGNLLEEVASGS